MAILAAALAAAPPVPEDNQQPTDEQEHLTLIVHSDCRVAIDQIMSPTNNQRKRLRSSCRAISNAMSVLLHQHKTNFTVVLKHVKGHQDPKTSEHALGNHVADRLARFFLEKQELVRGQVQSLMLQPRGAYSRADQHDWRENRDKPLGDNGTGWTRNRMTSKFHHNNGLNFAGLSMLQLEMTDGYYSAHAHLYEQHDATSQTRPRSAAVPTDGSPDQPDHSHHVLGDVRAFVKSELKHRQRLELAGQLDRQQRQPSHQSGLAAEIGFEGIDALLRAAQPNQQTGASVLHAGDQAMLVRLVSNTLPCGYNLLRWFESNEQRNEATFQSSRLGPSLLAAQLIVQHQDGAASDRAVTQSTAPTWSPNCALCDEKNNIDDQAHFLYCAAHKDDWEEAIKTSFLNTPCKATNNEPAPTRQERAEKAQNFAEQRGRDLAFRAGIMKHKALSQLLKHVYSDKLNDDGRFSFSATELTAVKKHARVFLLRAATRVWRTRATRLTQTGRLAARNHRRPTS